MLKKFFKTMATGLALGCTFWACDSGTATVPTQPSGSSNQPVNTVIPVDYTLGRTMNARLGRGINLGNSWDSEGKDDRGWSNPIRDTDFKVIKDAGFNSVRIPVQWHQDANKTTHSVNENRLAGVLEDIQLAIANDLAVVVNFHHYGDLNCAGGGGYKWDSEEKKQVKCTYNAAEFEAEKAHFLAMWSQLASVLNAFPDNMLVLEILNEPIIPNGELVDNLMNDAYAVIRAAAPGKTIMFESYHAAKFADLDILHLPQDGNIIYSGHFYEPYSFTHQGHSDQYGCKGDAPLLNVAEDSLAYYKKQALKLYPDVNGIDHVPLNMGEFGVSGGDPARCQKGDPPSDQTKAYWTSKAAKAAIENGMSFHYWGFGKTGGFDAYDTVNEEWYYGFPQALIF